MVRNQQFPQKRVRGGREFLEDLSELQSVDSKLMPLGVSNRHTDVPAFAQHFPKQRFLSYLKLR
jgi:hypothetical protein